MKNIEQFNEFVLHIFAYLYDAFPVPCTICPEEFVKRVEVSQYPPRPVDAYCGPDMSWGINNSDYWAAHSWDETEIQVQSLLARSLTHGEKVNLRESGLRPLTPEEQQAISKWEEEKRKIDNIRSTQQKQLEEENAKLMIFIATLQFLNNENFIRFTDLNHASQDSVHTQPDILIERNTKRLKFVLTSQGFSHLNRSFKGGKIEDDMPLFKMIKRFVKERSVEGGVMFAADILVNCALS